MADTELEGASPAEDAPLLPAETQAADSSPAPEKAPDEAPADDAGKEQPRDEDGKFLSAKAQKRIDELTWKAAEREREAAYWRNLAMQAQQAPKPAEPVKPEPPVKAPTLADFEYDENKYQQALIEFTRAEARREAEALLTRREQEARERAAQESWAKRERDFAAKNPAYVEKVLRDPTLPISVPMAEAIRDSEDGPALALWLAENREIAETIAALPERQAVKQLGRIEERLASQREAAKRPSAPKPVVSQAPPPPPKIEASEPEVEKDPDKMPVDDWLKWRNKNLSRKR